MNEIVINRVPLPIKEYDGKRVVTFKDIDTVHERPEGTAERNFRNNRQHFIETEDFFILELTNDEIRRQFGAGKNAGKTKQEEKNMNEIIINKTPLQVKEYNGKRVVTLKDIDTVHERPEGTARKRFNDNKKHFIEGEDYFKVCASEIRTHKVMEISAKTHEDITLVTESGYLMLVKSFTDDLAWQVQRQLVNSYFRVRQVQKQYDTAIQKLDAQARADRAIAMRMNAENRRLKLLLDNPHIKELSPESLMVLGISNLQKATGEDFSYALPEIEKTYSATEAGQMLGISANKVGKTANAYHLKTKEYGIFVLDKSRHSSKQVSTFRYNMHGISKLAEILNVEIMKNKPIFEKN